MRQLRELSRYVSAGCINMVAKLLFKDRLSWKVLEDQIIKVTLPLTT